MALLTGSGRHPLFLAGAPGAHFSPERAGGQASALPIDRIRAGVFALLSARALPARMPWPLRHRLRTADFPLRQLASVLDELQVASPADAVIVGQMR